MRYSAPPAAARHSNIRFWVLNVLSRFIFIIANPKHTRTNKQRIWMLCSQKSERDQATVQHACSAEIVIRHCRDISRRNFFSAASLTSSGMATISGSGKSNAASRDVSFCLFVCVCVCLFQRCLDVALMDLLWRCLFACLGFGCCFGDLWMLLWRFMDVALTICGGCFSDLWMMRWRFLDVALAMFGCCFSDLWMLL